MHDLHPRLIRDEMKVLFVPSLRNVGKTLLVVVALIAITAGVVTITSLAMSALLGLF